MRWADFELKEQPSSSPEEKARIMQCVRDFEIALANIVKLVAEAQHLMPNSHPETLRRIRKYVWQSTCIFFFLCSCISSSNYRIARSKC